MPIVRIDLLEGRSSSVKAELMAQVTNAEHVRVVLYEIPLEHWSVGGRTKAESARQHLKEEP